MPRIVYERDDTLGRVTGFLLGILNRLFKLIVGTLASLIWLFRGVYANINDKILINKELEICTLNTLGLDSSALSTMMNKQHYENYINQAVEVESTVSDFSFAKCLQIINNYDDTKKKKY
ncbi:unnamed protein product [Rotaria socialis]|uniref:Uncharacterized protein n=1 Tax=Rotaria socialis TaxID=392032 RepID=A0A821MSH6_9BILA|nr:unnamed protein product [Rotaria socialis]CAF3456271.1 unnamed protein product [Rotaria socialis]CAF3484724.1 unnamed protein product [Rotaria socialis]CAF4436445.1 unnamed protein product [Rotaria socialis]CAF4507223.1 unnamed protein product [Rotaria socialis]